LDVLRSEHPLKSGALEHAKIALSCIVSLHERLRERVAYAGAISLTKLMSSGLPNAFHRV
jgi:hypothetical protein